MVSRNDGEGTVRQNRRVRSNEPQEDSKKNAVKSRDFEKGNRAPKYVVVVSLI
jgi:hypothetical protein